MNEPLQAGPCAGNEFDLTEFHDGALDGERRRSVEEHLRTCPRCRAWLAEFAAVDQALAAALPRPALAADFDQRLQARIAGLARTQSRTQLLDEEDRRYDRMLSVLGSGARWGAVANGIAAAAVVGCVFSAGRALLTHWAPALPALGTTASVAWPSALGFAVAALALAFSVRRGLRVA